MPKDPISRKIMMKYVAGFQRFAGFSCLYFKRASLRKGFGVIDLQKEGRIIRGNRSVQGTRSGNELAGRWKGVENRKIGRVEDGHDGRSGGRH